MNVFYITNWPVHSGLSCATAWPNVRFLGQHHIIGSVTYFTVETEDVEPVKFGESRVRHVPIRVSTKSGALNRLIDEVKKNRLIKQEAKKRPPGLVICRGAPSSMTGRRIGRKLSVPVVVESFEPHADYMYHAGVWRKFGIKYILTKLAERSSKRNANYIITVSDLYREHLVRNEDLPKERVLNAPCAPDYETFYFDALQRDNVRKLLKIEDRFCICYIGKFGGLYYDVEAFQCMKYIFDILNKKAFFVILTETSLSYVKSQMESIGISQESFFCAHVCHQQVNRYLSASDFSLSFHKPTPYAFAFSPIKHAEYWANGLPVMMPLGIGEESDWAHRERVGVGTDIGDPNHVRISVKELRRILAGPAHRERIREVSRQRRSLDATYEAYNVILYGARTRADLERCETE